MAGDAKNQGTVENGCRYLALNGESPGTGPRERSDGGRVPGRWFTVESDKNEYLLATKKAKPKLRLQITTLYHSNASLVS